MKTRTFYSGQQFQAGGVSFRVTGGEKGNGDLRLDWLVNGCWQPVLLDAVFAVVHFVTENEDVLYPYPAKGGQEVIRYCQMARSNGWEHASNMLQIARIEKARRLEEMDV